MSPSMNPVLRFVKMSMNAYTPTKGSDKAAGFDLHSAYDYVIPASGKMLCATDIQICVPPGHYGRVAPRSGLAHKNFIDVGAGVIDEDYRGNVGVILFNFGNKDFEVKRGDRIAQLICERISYPTLEEVASLDDTKRGGGGIWFHRTELVSAAAIGFNLEPFNGSSLNQLFNTLML